MVSISLKGSQQKKGNNQTLLIATKSIIYIYKERHYPIFLQPVASIIKIDPQDGIGEKIKTEGTADIADQLQIDQIKKLVIDDYMYLRWHVINGYRFRKHHHCCLTINLCLFLSGGKHFYFRSHRISGHNQMIEIKWGKRVDPNT